MLFGIALIICFEVTVRALGGASQLWVIEGSEYALLFITFLGAPYLLEKNMHVVLDLLYDSLSGRPRLALQVLNASIGFVLCAVLTVVGISVVIEQFDLGVRQVTVMRPLSWWITAALPLGMGLMAIQFLFQAIRSLRGEVL
nr:TRAP transporter small permease [Hasllibacter sp. MH4015]